MVKTSASRAWSDAFRAGLAGVPEPIGPKLDEIERWLTAARGLLEAEAELAEALAPFATAAGELELERARRIAAVCRRAADVLAELNCTAAEPVAPLSTKGP